MIHDGPQRDSSLTNMKFIHVTRVGDIETNGKTTT